MTQRDRIVIIGPTGVGKSHLANLIAQKLGMPIIELDELYWLPNWQRESPEIFCDKVTKAVARPTWIVTGNYSQNRDLIWPLADQILWLDLPLPVVFARLLKRTLRQLFRREIKCNGNLESWQRLFSKDSIILWLLKSYWKKHREYAGLMTHPGYQAKFIRIANSTDQQNYLNSLSA